MNKPQFNEPYCYKCGKPYEIREGKYGAFICCVDYPECKTSIKPQTLFLNFLKNNGINVYRYYKQCEHCGNIVPVYSYLIQWELLFEYGRLVNEFDYSYTGLFGPEDSILPFTLGSLSSLDEIISGSIKSIKYVNCVYMYDDGVYRNVCTKCGVPISCCDFNKTSSFYKSLRDVSRCMNNYWYANYNLKYMPQNKYTELKNQLNECFLNSLE